jgi:ribose 5-phosphate isomerase B
MAKTLIVGSDHAGLELKRELVGIAAELGYEVRDVGTHTSDSTDYPDYAHQVSSAVASGEGLGLLVCGTGLGMSMAANRHPGVRAAVCGDVFSASMTRQHNDANVLCLGSRVVGAGLASEILKAFLNASFEGGRHERRVNKIEPSNEG